MVQLRFTQLGMNKPTFVKTSNKNMRKTLQYQLDQAKAQDIGDKEPDEQIELSLKLIDDTEDYIVDMLGLDDKGKNKLENLELEQSTEIATRISLRLNGLSDQEIDKIFADDGEDEVEDEQEKN